MGEDDDRKRSSRRRLRDVDRDRVGGRCDGRRGVALGERVGAITVRVGEAAISRRCCVGRRDHVRERAVESCAVDVPRCAAVVGGGGRCRIGGSSSCSLRSRARSRPRQRAGRRWWWWSSSRSPFPALRRVGSRHATDGRSRPDGRLRQSSPSWRHLRHRGELMTDAQRLRARVAVIFRGSGHARARRLDRAARACRAHGRRVKISLRS